MLGLDALILLRDKNFLVFFFCSFLFAMPLAFYYIFANGYLTEVGMKNATGWMTLGQFSEIFFMLALPFFTKRFGIKKVLLLGLITAAIRYGFFVYGGAEQLHLRPAVPRHSAARRELRLLLRHRVYLRG
jgi:Na+/melibiose symporter-like transporter